MIFDNAIPFETLPESDAELKSYLNYNPVHNSYTKKQNIPGRNPNETDRGGWRGYDRVYFKYFQDLRTKKLSIMEIGIKEGYGIYAWQRYFENSTIYGIDNDWNSDIIYRRNELKKNHGLFNKARLYNINSTKEDHWIEFYGKKFDIIIDDGDHHPITQIKTFECAWKYLKAGGLYFIEDIGHRYGKEEIQKLSDFILSHTNEFDILEIYSHDNVGLNSVFKDSNYLKHNKNRVVMTENLNTTEYIVAIRKKME